MLFDVKNNIKYIGLIFGLILMTYAFTVNNISLWAAIAFFPLFGAVLVYSIDNPVVVFYIVFMINYLIMWLTRYITIPFTSVLMDTILLVTLLFTLMNKVYKKKLNIFILNNTLVWGTLLWAIFCVLTLVNPSSIFAAWLGSKNLIYNPFLVAVITLFSLDNLKHLKGLVFIFSLLSLLAFLKAFMQKFYGFDAFERIWLESGAKTTHIIYSGIRYFSIFTDAGNMGSNMGFSSFFFFVCASSFKDSRLKIWYLLISLTSFYCMMISGTRGAIIVPIGAFAAYAVLSKNFKVLILSIFILGFFYVFFAFTNIGQSNATIRRMRTAFRPTEDASFNVRIRNQKILANYLRYKPLGEGIGLSGGENIKYSRRFTTMIPYDSWLVKIWVETGVIGISIYISILFIVFLKCSYIIMCKIKNKEYRGLCIAIVGGNFGLLLSSYANPFFGQYPTHYVFYIGLAIVMGYKYLDDSVENQLGIDKG